MILKHISPLGSLDGLSRNLDRIFDEVLGSTGTTACRPGGGPALNIWEDADAYTVEVETPGMAMDDLSVEVLGSDLTISGEWNVTEIEDSKVHRRERSAGAFRRTLSLPDDVEPNGVDATLKNGVLTIRLPKAEVARARRIDVKGD